MRSKVNQSILISLAVVLVSSLILSLRWKTIHDTSVMLYISYLIEHFHYIPYRDIFDINLPGTYLIYISLSKIFGYSDPGIRIADIFYLTSIFTMTWFWLKDFGNKVAWGSLIIFGLVYIKYGPYNTLQREYLILLPLTTAILFTFSFNKLNIYIKSLIIGLCFGVSLSIKPHSIIGLPILILYLSLSPYEKRVDMLALAKKYLLTILISFIGLLIPATIIILYLYKIRSLVDFIDIFSNYIPLYSQLTNKHYIVSGYSRFIYLWKNYFVFLTHQLMIIPAIIGVYINLYRSEIGYRNRVKIFILIGLTIVYSLYTVIAGQFWRYHWLLFYFFLYILAGLNFVNNLRVKGKFIRLLPSIILVSIIMLD